jgi:CheY-like chemotaxis protein
VPTVLVVDDEVLMRHAIRRAFERGGVDVVEARDADQALALLDGGQALDAVVSDVVMPGLNGLAFYDQLITRMPALGGRVVFLTGSADDPAVNLPIEQRGVPLLSKGGDLRLVVDAVRLILLRNLHRPGPGTV